MRALVMKSFESGASLADVPVPAPGPRELLVRVHAASVNPVDLAVTGGALKDVYAHEFPVTLGRDFAGVVEQVGDEVAGYAPGDEVFGFVHVAGPHVHAGSFAERLVIAEDAAVAPKPAELSFLQAAVLPLSGTVATLAVEAVAPAPGKLVLVAGATGGVGRYAVELAAARGASVIATGLPDDDADLRELGADEVVDYTQNIAEAVRTAHPQGLDGLIYLVHPPADFPALAELVGAGGRVATSVHAADPEALAARGVTAANIMAAADRSSLGRLAELVRTGALTPRIERTYPFERIADGFAHIASGTARGKLAVSIAPPA